VKYGNAACAALLDPHAAEPLVWPSPLKFMSEGELEPEAKTVLEAALAQANGELDQVHAEHINQIVKRKSKSRNGRLKIARTFGSSRPDSPLQAVEAKPIEACSEEARSSTAGDLPSASSSATDVIHLDLPTVTFAKSCRSNV
jgi:hypothetical protein